jgi:hypothetical protein
VPTLTRIEYARVASLRLARSLGQLALHEGRIISVVGRRKAPTTERGRKIAATRLRNGFSQPDLPAGAIRLTTYDARRAWSCWMADAGVAAMHRKAYLGHGKSITALYEERPGEATRVLRLDGKRFRAYVDRQLQRGAADAPFGSATPPADGTLCA